jgi:hypothetical protein
MLPGRQIAAPSSLLRGNQTQDVLAHIPEHRKEAVDEDAPSEGYGGAIAGYN